MQKNFCTVFLVLSITIGGSIIDGGQCDVVQFDEPITVFDRLKKISYYNRRQKVIQLLIRIAGIVPESFVDGDGIRYAVFMQGCLRNCDGCQNPETHALDGGRLVDTNEIISALKKNPLLDGITLTGGEPFFQVDAADELARAAKNFGLSVWCYTGYTLEEIPPETAPLLENIDVLIDGAFVESLRDLNLQFRGSSNQRIIDMKKTREQKKIVLWNGG